MIITIKSGVMVSYFVLFSSLYFILFIIIKNKVSFPTKEPNVRLKSRPRVVTYTSSVTHRPSTLKSYTSTEGRPPYGTPPILSPTTPYGDNHGSVWSPVSSFVRESVIWSQEYLEPPKYRSKDEKRWEGRGKEEWETVKKKREPY